MFYVLYPFVTYLLTPSYILRNTDIYKTRHNALCSISRRLLVIHISNLYEYVTHLTALLIFFQSSVHMLIKGGL
jgi:hypothetical protein